MSNSSFTPAVLTIPAAGGSGSGQGELNVVTNPSAATDLTGWTASGITLSRDSSGSPLDPVIGTGFNLLTSAAGQTVTSSSLTVPASLRNKKLKLEFYMTQATAAFKVDVLNSSGARFTLTTDSSGASNLPALSASGKYTTYFDMDSGSSIQVRFTSILASGTLKVTQVIVGPGIQPQGAVVGEWQSYTPTIDGFGTVTPLEARYRRVGSSIEVVAKWTNGTPAASAARVYVPTGLTVAAASQTQIVGRWYRDSATGSARKSSPILQLNSAQQYVIFSSDDYTTASGPYTGLNGSALAVAGESVGVNFTVPIAEWAGSGTVTLAQNDVEYASNTNQNSTDTASFAYGPNGSLLPSTTIATNFQTKRIRFQTPIQSTDILTVELNIGAGWFALSGNEYQVGFQPLTYQGTTIYGIGFDWARTALPATDINVMFGKYYYAGSGTYGAAGSDWNATTGGYRWRVRKSSAGAAVGFGLADTVSSGLVRNRTSWTDLVRNDMTITATGGGTITVDAGDVSAFYWKQIDDTVIVSFKLITMSISGTVQYFTIALPSTVPLATAAANTTCIVYDNTSTANTTGSIEINPGTRSLIISKLGGTNFTASTNLTYVYGQITYRIY